MLNLRKQSDYKLCGRLHTFIGKQVISAQELNAHYCKEKLLFFTNVDQVGISTLATGVQRRRKTAKGLGVESLVTTTTNE